MRRTGRPFRTRGPSPSSSVPPTTLSCEVALPLFLDLKSPTSPASSKHTSFASMASGRQGVSSPTMLSRQNSVASPASIRTTLGQRTAAYRNSVNGCLNGYGRVGASAYTGNNSPGNTWYGADYSNAIAINLEDYGFEVYDSTAYRMLTRPSHHFPKALRLDNRLFPLGAAARSAARTSFPPESDDAMGQLIVNLFEAKVGGEAVQLSVPRSVIRKAHEAEYLAEALRPGATALQQHAYEAVLAASRSCKTPTDRNRPDHQSQVDDAVRSATAHAKLATAHA
ncbi:hypothetical protein NMY22_g9728 [Coprinellus aureogranulatus]|nr:hypothetical protein NMY22_g9728 [Coprinellus aureogranulatus]